MKSGIRVVVNTFSQVASRGLVVLISLLTTGLLTRMFGSTGYGNYIFITSFIFIFISLSDLGVTLTGVRESSAKKDEKGAVFDQILALRSILTLMLFFLFNLAILFLPQFAGLRLSAFIASFVVFFLTLRTVSQGVLQANLRLDLASTLEIFASLLFLILIFVFKVLGRSVSLNLLMFFWLTSALVSAILGWFISRQYHFLKPSFVKKEMVRLFKEALPLGVYILIFSVYDRGIDSFILKTFFPISIVGYYGLAYKIHGNLVLGAAFLMNSLFPLLSSLKDDLKKLRQIYEKAFTLLLLSGFILLSGGLIFAPWVIKVIAGPGFTPSILALRLLLGATFFSYLNHLTGFLMIALGKQKKLLAFSLIAFLVNLSLNLVFIPLFSFPAAAVITILTELTIFIFTQNFLARNFNLRFSPKAFGENLGKLLNKKEHFFDKL